MRLSRVFLFVIFIFALFLRTFHLGSIPGTLYGDEQAFAWNAYSILKTGADEYGTSYPLFFKSFEDYKAPIPVYLLTLLFGVFDMTPFTIRFPVAFSGALTVFACYFFARRFLNIRLSLIAAFLLAISPWHLHLSRGYFEATIALLFYVTGFIFLLSKRQEYRDICLSAVFFSLSLYTYFTPRITVPLICLVFFAVYLINLKKKGLLKPLFFSFLLFIISIPLILFSIQGKGLSRFEKLSATNQFQVEEEVNRARRTSRLPDDFRRLFHNKGTVYINLVKSRLLEHFSPNFWYIFGDDSLRYFLGGMGMFYLWEFPFLVMGIFTLYLTDKKYLALFFIYLFIASIPSGVVGRSFAIRSLAMLPVPFFLVSVGMFEFIKKFRKAHIQVVAAGFLSFLSFFALGSVLIKYYFEYPLYAATWWGWENKAAIDYALEREDEFDSIFISDFYTGSVMAYAVYTKVDPKNYQKAVNNPVVLADGRKFINIGKYYFGSFDVDKERLSLGIIPQNSLYIGRPEEADSNITINAPDDARIIFKIFKT